MIVLRIVLVIVGVLLIVWPFLSAARTFVVPRSHANVLSGIVFRTLRRIFGMIARRLPTYEQRDGLMAVYAPLSLLLLVAACGNKGPVRPLESPVPGPVAQVQLVQRGEGSFVSPTLLAWTELARGDRATGRGVGGQSGPPGRAAIHRWRGPSPDRYPTGVV